MTSRCHTNQFDKLYIAFANTYCNLACIYRSQKKGTRAKLSIGYAISFSQQIQNKKERILNAITALINLTVIDSELNHSVLAIGHASRACLIILKSMTANFVTKNSIDSMADEFSFDITSAKDEEIACDLLMSGLYNLANQLEAHQDTEQARKVYRCMQYLNDEWEIFEADSVLSIKVQNALNDINLPFTGLEHLLDVSQIDTKVVLQKLISITGDNARLYSMYSNEICKYKSLVLQLAVNLRIVVVQKQRKGL